MGTKTNNVIEINGKRYDAINGSLLGDSGLARVRPSIDGFVRVNRAAKPAPVRPAHAPAQHAAAHKPTPSKTLMRTAVKKPQIQAPAQLKTQTRTDILARKPNHLVTPKLSASAVNPSRLKKATQMVKNPAVSRYGSVHAIDPTAFSGQAALQPASQPVTAPAHTFRVADLQVAPVREAVKQPDMFEQAMARATSHEQTYDAKKAGTQKRSHVPALLSVAACLLLLAGTLAYFNIPSISVRLASSRAGFQAKLPNYSPMGYSFGNLSYGPGNVTVNYKSDTAHSFAITQRESNWDSQALLNNFVASANKAYQTYERAGRTIYFFGNNTATWVDNGIWYTVNGNNSLSKSQLLDLASSI